MMETKITDAKKWLTALNIQPFLQEAWSKAGFKEPTPIQEKALPMILEGKDVIAESPTGTGKTIAYLLPLLQRINPEFKGLQAVIVAPSHELAMQIFQTIEKWTKGSDITSGSFIGGANVNRQIEALKKRPQIIVGTTGRLLELIKLKKLKMHEVKTIVVDEFDVLIAQEHVDNIRNLIKTTLRDRQVLFFSATLSEKTAQIGQELMKEPELIQIKRGAQKNSNTQHFYLICEQREKIEMLPKIVRTEKGIKALAFINDLSKIYEIEAKLKYDKIPVGVLAGESNKQQRKEAINNFRIGKLPLLIATDVAARGLDIEGLTHVINWDIPRTSNQYIHRAGRTGRMGAAGTVISVVTRGEEVLLKKLTKKLNINVAKKKLFKGKLIDIR